MKEILTNKECADIITTIYHSNNRTVKVQDIYEIEQDINNNNIDYIIKWLQLKQRISMNFHIRNQINSVLIYLRRNYAI